MIYRQSLAWARAWARGGLLAGLLLGAAACARPAVFIQATALDGHTSGVKLAQAARTRIIFNRAAGATGWPSLALRNDGAAALRKIQLWDVAGDPFFAPLKAPSIEPPAQFSLLPGESLASTVFEGPGGKIMLMGLTWSIPAERTAARADFSRLSRARLEERPATSGGGPPAPIPALVLTPQGGEAQAELTFSAPIAFNQVQLSFQTVAPPGAPRAAPSVWVSVENNVWARVTPPPLGVSPARPLDLSPLAAGHRELAIRLAVEQPPVAGDPASGLIVVNMNLQCQWELPGDWRAWRPGLNEFDVDFASSMGSHPALAVELTDFGATPPGAQAK